MLSFFIALCSCYLSHSIYLLFDDLDQYLDGWWLACALAFVTLLLLLLMFCCLFVRRECSLFCCAQIAGAGLSTFDSLLFIDNTSACSTGVIAASPSVTHAAVTSPVSGATLHVNALSFSAAGTFKVCYRPVAYNMPGGTFVQIGVLTVPGKQMCFFFLLLLFFAALFDE